MENFKTYFGLWWFADDPENRFQAVLTVVNGTANLCYFGKFQQLSFHLSSDIGNIFGLATDLETHDDYSFKLYSLYESKRSNATLSKIILSTKLFLIGKPNRKENSSQFKSLHLTSYLWKFWLNKSGFKADVSPMENKQFAYEVQYNRPEKVTLFQDDNLTIKVFFRAGLSNTTDDQKLLTEDPILTTNFTKNLELKSISKYREQLERFLMILWEDVHLFSITEVVSVDNTVFTVFDNRRSFGRRSRFAVKNEDFIENFEKWFSSWLFISKKYEYPINTFFFALTGHSMDIHSEFLSFTFGLERFHKQLIGSSAKLSQGIAALISRLDSDAKQKYEDLDLLGIEKTRHYLVHLDEKHKSYVIPSQKLAWVNDTLIELMFKLLKTVMIK